MKKTIFSVVAMVALLVSSCSDMLDVDSGREVETPGMNQASDSLYFVAGILQAVQQAVDAYVLQNEMRGDLTDVTPYTELDIRQLANFSATTSNKYDSAYVYYRVINNCNYYLAHRDTTILDGTYNVVRNEYAAVLAFRAWAYLQLVRNYGKVKFFTRPLESLTDIETDNSEELGIHEIVARLADDGEQALKRFSGCERPYGTWAGYDGMWLGQCCIPVDVMLGELYLEAGRYAEAADYYFKYLLQNRVVAVNLLSSVDMNKAYNMNLPSDYSPTTVQGSNEWFQHNFEQYSTEATGAGTITIIPFAADKFRGVTTVLPSLFGYDYYYSDSEGSDSRYLDELQIVPSSVYNQLADSSVYYYTSAFPGQENVKGTVALGDQRAYTRFMTRDGEDVANDTTKYLRLYRSAVVWLFRSTTVWLHLAEAFNRMGHPDAAFAILKDGITTSLLSDTTYITDATKELWVSRYPFCTGEGATIFSGSTADERNYGIHRHGCGDQTGTEGTFSMYQMSTEVARKVAEIDKMFNLNSATSDPDDSLKVLINAVEDLLCDEYAMEFAFEGTRYSDLMRLARHKNESSPASYGANFGGRWLTRKLAHKTDKNFEDESNWYLPMK